MNKNTRTAGYKALMLGTALALGAQGATAHARAAALPAIPAGTNLTLTVEAPLSSEFNRAGDTFRLFVAEPVIVNGRVVIRAGTPVTGTVSVARPCGRLARQGRLGIDLDPIAVGNRTLAVAPVHAAGTADGADVHRVVHGVTSPVRDVANNVIAGIGDTAPSQGLRRGPEDGKAARPSLKSDLVTTDPLDPVEFRAPTAQHLAHRGVIGVERVATNAVNLFFGGPLGILKRGASIEVPAGSTVHAVVLADAQ